MTDTMHRDFRIYYDPLPIPTREYDWAFEHKNYDGPEDHRCGRAGSYAECVQEIDAMLDEEAV